jgi:hypothetical protein
VRIQTLDVSSSERGMGGRIPRLVYTRRTVAGNGSRCLAKDHAESRDECTRTQSSLIRERLAPHGSCSTNQHVESGLAVRGLTQTTRPRLNVPEALTLPPLMGAADEILTRGGRLVITPVKVYRPGARAGIPARSNVP